MGVGPSIVEMVEPSNTASSENLIFYSEREDRAKPDATS